MITVRCPQPLPAHPRPAAAPSSERAQATVEFVGTLPMLLLAAAACLQALLVAISLLFAQVAADRAAHGADRSRAVASMPHAWAARSRVSTQHGRAVVQVRPPAVLPGAARWLTVRASSRETSS
ncbi:MAG: hypothetical protein JWM98_3203 [Thermoleophilia bacterium]|nr:hypothetical protein [Thermoleophilia bacterium]